MEFVAFDFETANQQRYSACSLGAVKVVDGIMVEHFYTLIGPQTHCLWQYRNTEDCNTEVHSLAIKKGLVSLPIIL